MPHPGKTVRVEFLKEHDAYLMKYLAKYCPSKEGRSGLKVYQNLVDNVDGLWGWSKHHTVQSWRERYVKNSDAFDASISQYQRKHNIQPVPLVRKRKRATEPMPPPTPIEMLASGSKRARREEEEEERVPETRPASQRDNATPPKPKPMSKSMSKRPRDLPETPLQSPCKSELANAPAPSPSNAPTNATVKPDPDPTTAKTQDDTIEILSSPVQQAAPLLYRESEIHDTPRHVKRIRVRVRTPSDLFASEPSSPPRVVPPVFSNAGPPSQPQSAPSAGADSSKTVATAVYPRAPPRVVDSFHGQVLVDREGHVPRTVPRGEDEDEEDEEEKEKDEVQWPPVRGTAKPRKPDEPDVEAHHPFSQVQTQPRPAAPRESDEREQRTTRLPGLDLRTIAARLSGPAHRDTAQVENKQREDAVQHDASPVKRVVTTAPSSDPFTDILRNACKTFKFPAPRASTQSPFQPEPPVAETRPLPPPTRMAHPLALTRNRRRTLDHPVNGNGSKHERRRDRDPIPSVDLVAFSRSTSSARSHSRSSAATSVPVRHPRWSLPASVQTAPVFDEDRGARSRSVSGSGSFGWTAPSPVYGDVLGYAHERAQMTSIVGTPTPRFISTPPPGRSVTANGSGAVPRVHTSGVASPSMSLVPYPSDVDVTARHGLAMMLRQMSANHGFSLDVAENVYKEVGGLREADEVLRGMREAAEAYGEWKIERQASERRRSGVGERERRDGDRRTRLRYVMASEDGEGSEYSPPETSQAAMWKRRSESASYANEDDEDDEEEEGRAVEEELCQVGEDNQEEDEASSRHSQESEPGGEEQVMTVALLEDTKFAQELERKVGRGRYRRDIARLFA